MGFRVWPVDEEGFTTYRVCPIRHDFDKHPLMQLPALAQLAKELAPSQQCRFVRPGMTAGSAFHHEAAHPDGRDIDEVFRRIEEPGSWIALYHVETQPLYKAFLDEVIGSVKERVEREQPGIYMIHGFIFISAPPSVTPFHIDRENNFWLQIRGRKTMNVWEPTDRAVVAAEDVDSFIVYASLDNVTLRDGYVERSHTFDVGPGEGVYFPSTSPHMTRSDRSWTTPGDGVSISIGVDFYTEHTRRRAYVHAWNLFLRRVGIQPREPGTSTPLDTVKHAFGRGLVWGKKSFRGYKPTAGF